MKHWAPPEWQEKVYQLFTGKVPAFGQLATVDKQGHPHVRTVHFHLVDNEQIVFNCHTQSEKWTQLESQAIECCLYRPSEALQIRWTGPTKRFTQGPLVTTMWMHTREEVRQTYWEDYANRTKTQIEPLDLVCPWFGSVACQPTRWEFYEDHSDYCRVLRTEYQFSEGKWVKRSLASFHSLSG